MLIGLYSANLVYTLVTHRDVFASAEARKADHAAESRWPLPLALGVMVGLTAAIALEAEIVAGALELTANSLGLSTWFEGVLLIGVYVLFALAFFFSAPTG